MYRAPDRRTDWPLRRRPTRQWVQSVELGHVLERDFDAQLKPLLLTGIHNGDWTVADRTRVIFLCRDRQRGNVHSAKEPGYFFQWTLCGGKPHALELASAETFEALHGKSEMRSALGRHQGMDLVND